MSVEPAFTGMPCCTTMSSVSWSSRSAVKTMPLDPQAAAAV
jgi:hypothetical protein